jgi:hypothetical protein
MVFPDEVNSFNPISPLPKSGHGAEVPSLKERRGIRTRKSEKKNPSRSYPR